MSTRLSVGAVAVAALLPLALTVLPAPAHGQTLNWKPEVSWSTYLGGSKFDDLHGLAVNAQGEVFVTGKTLSVGTFPADAGLPASNSGYDAFVAKFRADGTRAWVRVFGGTASDSGQEVALGPSGEVYVVGTTQSAGWLAASGVSSGVNTHQGAKDAFLARLDAEGTLSWFMYLGGSGDDEAYDVAVGPNNRVYVAGRSSSSNFLANLGGRNSNRDAFVTQVDVSTPSIQWTRFIGSQEHDDAYAVAVHESAVYVGGVIGDLVGGLPSGVVPRSNFGSGDNDGFIAKLSDNGAVVWFTYVGGNGDDVVRDILMRPGGASFVVMGNAKGASNFPAPGGSSDDVFLVDMDPEAAILRSLRVGGASSEVADSHAAMDARGNIFIGGKMTSEKDYLVNAWDETRFSDEGFVLMVDASLTQSKPLWASYVGGSELAANSDISTGQEWVRALAVGPSGQLTFVGHSSAGNLPVMTRGFDTNANGAEDGFIYRVLLDSTPPVGSVDASLDPEGYITATWSFSDLESQVVGYAWAISERGQVPPPEAFNDVGSATSGTDRGFSPMRGRSYTVTVRATNGSGVSSLGTDTVEVPLPGEPGTGSGGGEGQGEVLSPLGWGCGAGGGSLMGMLSVLALTVLSSRRRGSRR